MATQEAPPTVEADPDAGLLGLVRMAVDAGDLDTAKRALAELEARRRERAGVVTLQTARRKRS